MGDAHQISGWSIHKWPSNLTFRPLENKKITRTRTNRVKEVSFGNLTRTRTRTNRVREVSFGNLTRTNRVKASFQIFDLETWITRTRTNRVKEVSFGNLKRL